MQEKEEVITIDEQLKAAKRELALRERVYPGWVTAGRMRPDLAAHEIECMKAIVATLDRQLDLFQIGEEMKAKERERNPPKTCEMCGGDLEKGACPDCDVLII